MCKIILIISVVIIALILTAAGFVFYIIHYVAPRSGEMVSLSAPPDWYRRPLLFITDNTLFIPTRGLKHLRYRGLAVAWLDFVKIK
jgi:hypothetical protein